VKRSRYTPAMADGAARAVRIRQPVSFSIEGMEPATTEPHAEEAALSPVRVVASPSAKMKYMYFIPQDSLRTRGLRRSPADSR
jgi:hypothetical protein